MKEVKSFTGMESVGMFKDGLFFLINNISQMRHSNFPQH